jgi:hypothetical protein
MNNLSNKLVKCDFCKFKSNAGCMVMPNSSYCREANDEYYHYLRTKNGSNQPPIKSLRSWDKK